MISRYFSPGSLCIDKNHFFTLISPVSFTVKETGLNGGVAMLFLKDKLLNKTIMKFTKHSISLLFMASMLWACSPEDGAPGSGRTSGRTR